MTQIYRLTACLSLLLVVVFSSCKKPLKLSKENLNFSIDTLVFDTVFTTVGSTTMNFRFYNPSNQTLVVEEVELMGGTNSPFRMNVDGVKGTIARNIEMEGKDSLFVFVEVTLDPNGQNLPMVIEDRIRFRTNGKDQFVQLAAWGQDAYFHRNDVNSGTWPVDKPHVIYGYAGIDSAQTLTIPAGAQIFLHKNSLIYNYKGTLNIEGTKTNKVTLQSDRLESFYDDVPGQYYGIYFEKARPSTIEHLELKNGTAGIHLFSRDDSFTDYTLTIRNSEIYNNSRYGVFIYSGAKVKAENCLIYKNALHALLVLEGGSFNFNYCHLLGYASSSQTPAVGISNYFKDATGTLNIGSIPEGTITNSVLFGNEKNELVLDTLQFNGQVVFNFEFNRCLIKLETPGTEAFYKGVIWNSDPLFVNTAERDFTWYSTSPLNASANHNFFLPIDFLEVNRDNSQSDIGAFEKP